MNEEALKRDVLNLPKADQIEQAEGESSDSNADAYTMNVASQGLKLSMRESLIMNQDKYEKFGGASIFHQRRVETNYLIGFRDLEREVEDEIHTNKAGV